MLYLRICFDKQNSSGLRDELRKQHREYIAGFLGGKDGIKVVQGGPMCANDDVGKSIGGFLVIEAGSSKDALQFHNDDPFTQAKLFDRSEVVRWDRHVGNKNQTAFTP